MARSNECHDRRRYSLGRLASLDITTVQATHGANLSSVLLSSGDGNEWFSSGVQLLMAGVFPAGDGTGAAAPGLDQWSNNYQFPIRHKLAVGQRMGLSLQAWPNNRPFPLSTLRSASPSATDAVQAMLMGPYAAAAGCLFSYQSMMTMNGTSLIADEQLHPRRTNYNNRNNSDAFLDSPRCPSR